MKIFILLSRIPWPLEKGDKLRAYNQIKCLAKNNEIFLCALNDDKSVDKDLAINELQPYCKEIRFFDLPKASIPWNLGKAFLQGKPLQCGYFYNKRIHRHIKRIIAEYEPDILYGQLVRVAPYLQDEQIAKALDYQDIFSMGMKRRADLASIPKRWIFTMEYKRLRAYEKFVFDKFNVKTIICDADRQHIEHPNRNEILVVPNGVDFEIFQPQTVEKKYDLIFSGNMAYPPNVNAVDFLAHEILPLVHEQLPRTTLCIAGATPAQSVKAVASEHICVTGWVDNMRDAYARCSIFIAPMRIGTGLQNKLLEAMAMGMPCITTPLANDSLQATEGKEILIGNSAEELAQHIITLLSDKRFSEQIATAGHSFVHEHYDWESTTLILEDAMASTTDN